MELILWESPNKPCIQQYIEANLINKTNPDGNEENLPKELKEILEEKRKKIKINLEDNDNDYRRTHQSAPVQMETIRELSLEENGESDDEAIKCKKYIIKEKLEGTTEIKEGSNGLDNNLTEILANMCEISSGKHSERITGRDTKAACQADKKEGDCLKFTSKWESQTHSKHLSEEIERQGLLYNPDSSQLMQLLVKTISSIEVELANNFDCFSHKFVELVHEVTNQKQEVLFIRIFIRCQTQIIFKESK